MINSTINNIAPDNYDFAGITIYNILGKAYTHDGEQFTRVGDDSVLMEQMWEDCDLITFMEWY